MKTLILGGARSGKSAHAEQLASQSNKSVIYIATGWAGDAEMAKRIAHHQQQRPAHWQTVESPQGLAATLLEQDGANNLLLVDCLTLWISNCLANDCLAQEMAAVLNLVPRLQSELIFVSNEVGSGVVPLGELSREFVDNAGRLHQRLATLCDRVLLVVAGLPLSLK
ncbi:bifunctional adenosylcobinamide kinase/adenosylcobinamide-phosphate guanylyltransferase [Teredinibacter turnerae]|uniref:bifunctional adenosylcobinamide kinase/adenosylcobinamide-phosphate guanylyltransferase n=1 Tax=Teredinibacter turnerae TaxID=2426 RepID=UPI00040BD38F|nr:bifunctional adenosylcobinamide kinase/adenosylcobinamide-phosphate guanylyltransferase [Teredinibacter turnerae]